jgi:hypothetical protein
MAMWLTDKKNPLVARTMINRLWEQLFGFGIAETLEDLGTQGITPTHKELLDYLSWKFANDHHWSIKKILKEIVLSATYRQDSKVTKELLQKDPNNKMYARGPRVRLSAEQIRDQALSVSHVLSNKMYGKSVMPFQPEGVWKSPYSSNTWKLSEGDDQFRRGIYTFWKRSAPYPSMATFDGATREVCITRRIRTNTPLQALTIMNDSSYLVMARYFANRINEMGEKEVSKKMIHSNISNPIHKFKPYSVNVSNTMIRPNNKPRIHHFMKSNSLTPNARSHKKLETYAPKKNRRAKESVILRTAKLNDVKKRLPFDEKYTPSHSNVSSSSSL